MGISQSMYMLSAHNSATYTQGQGHNFDPTFPEAVVFKVQCLGNFVKLSSDDCTRFWYLCLPVLHRLWIWLFVSTSLAQDMVFCSGIQFNLLLSPYPCLIFLLYLDLYVLGDDALIS